MAEFNTGIQPLAGSATTPMPPVVDRSSSVTLDAFSDIAQTVVPGLLKTQVARQKAELEQMKNQALSNFAQTQLKLADAVDMGDISSQEARMRMRKNYTEAVANSPALVGDFAELQKQLVSTSGLGKVVADGTDKEKIWLAAEKEATLNGWVPPSAKGEGERLEATQNYLNFKRAQEDLQMQQRQVALQTAKINQQTAVYSRDSARLGLVQRERAERSRVAVGNLADSYNYKFNNDLQEIMARKDRGEISEQDAIMMVNQQYAIIQQTVSQIGSDAPSEYVNNITNPMKLRYQTALDYVSGKIDNEVLKNKNENILAQQKLNLLGDPEVARVVATSSMFQYASPNLLQVIDRKVVDKISQNMPSQTGGKPVDVMPDNDNEKQSNQSYLSMVKEGMTAFNGGRMNGDQLAERELDQHVSQMLKGINAYGPATERPQDFNQIVDFLADPQFGKYTSARGGVPADTAVAAKNVLSQQYEQAVIPLIRKEYEQARIIDLQATPSQALRGQATSTVSNPTDVIKPVFTGSGVVFQAKPDASLAIRRKAQDLNKSVSPVLNRLIRMSAHLDGNTDYRSTWQKNYEALFGIGEEENSANE
ncbi:putative hemagglutinin protein [Pseudomonas phage TC6]|uniref:Uncharacterized protein n=2 Tax=root TaxID=1 RepID=A0A2W5QM19_VARPD|nr:putative hemagglutinin protein [Pseudomonas phage TC6]PZQ78014.1 MAG: hypothetical protein DI563_01620 [Variovorax paradoxus]